MKRLISNVLLFIVTVAAVGLAKPVFAGSGFITDFIQNTAYYSSGQRFTQSPSADYMVDLVNVHGCGTQQAWLYTVESDLQYGNFIANLNYARIHQFSAKIGYSTDAGGYCRITSVVYNPR